MIQQKTQPTKTPKVPSPSIIEFVKVVMHYKDKQNKDTLKNIVVSRKMNLMHLQYVLKKDISFNHREGVFLFIGKNNMQSNEKTLGQLNDLYKEKDGFLHITCKTVEKF